MLGRSIGISDDEIAAMAESQTSALFDATDRLVLRYAETLTRENRVSDELYAELTARFPQDQLVELCFTVGLAALVNRIHATFRTDVDGVTQAAVGEAAFCPIGR
jgi:alkylhydroperoxidase family enzyme